MGYEAAYFQMVYEKKRYIKGLHRTSPFALGDGALQLFLQGIYMDGQDLSQFFFVYFPWFGGQGVGVIRLLSLYDERFWCCRWCWSSNALGLWSLSWSCIYVDQIDPCHYHIYDGPLMIYATRMGGLGHLSVYIHLIYGVLITEAWRAIYGV